MLKNDRRLIKNLLLKPDVFIRSIINLITLNVRLNNDKIMRNELLVTKEPSKISSELFQRKMFDISNDTVNHVKP